MTDEMSGFLFALPDLRGEDFSAHNVMAKALWEDFGQRLHARVPFRLNTNPRMLMLDPKYNVRGLSYETYMTDPEVMGQAVLEWHYWRRFLLPGDHEKGIPEHWEVHIDFENLYDAAWFGCPVCYRADQVPDTEPLLDDAHKHLLFDRGLPDPFQGEWAERALRFLEYFRDKSAKGWTFLGAPVAPLSIAPFMSFDGVFTVAASLRGATELCVDLLTDPDYARQLLEYISTAVIERMAAWRKLLDVPVPQDGFGTADDSIQLLSVEQYREFVLPLHRRLYERFATAKDRGMHLCGNAQRHFLTIKEELGVSVFDTGFPVDFGRLRREIGPQVLVSGGPQVSFFLRDSAEPIVAEGDRILSSGILEGGRFILQEGNNLPPCARLALCEALYETGKRLGRVRRS